MANLNSFLLRDTLSDSGSPHTSGGYSSSPDLICYPQVANPKEFFANNYTDDVTKPIDTASRTNALYVRGKNLNSSAISGRVAVYRSRMSLFMTPSVWKNNVLLTADSIDHPAVPYTEFTAAANSIAVCDTPLIIDGVEGSEFCLVGMAGDATGPVIPNDFSTYNAFTSWVMSNPGVCLRNQCYSKLTTQHQLEFAARMLNPEDKDVVGTFVVEITGAVKGTVYGIKNESMGIDNVDTVTSDNGKGRFTLSVFVPSHFDAFVSSFANAPGSSTLPTGVNMSVLFYYGALPDDTAYRFSAPAASIMAKQEVPKFGNLLESRGKRVQLANANLQLVLLGRCSVTYHR